MKESASPETILVLCTANVCRSQLAGRLLADGMERVWGEPITVASAGVQADPRATPCRLVQRLGLGGQFRWPDPSSLTPEGVQAATLILTATGEHRSVVTRLDPGARERTFTLVEAARILNHRGAPGQSPPLDASQDLRSLTKDMHLRRAFVPEPLLDRRARTIHQPLVWDIADGHGQGRLLHRRTLGEVERAVADFLHGIRVAVRLWEGMTT